MTEQDGSDKLMEMLAARQAPLNGTFRARWEENLTSEPVLITSHRQHKQLMREANCVEAGDYGQKDHIERGRERSEMNRKRNEARKKMLQTHTGRMPDAD